MITEAKTAFAVRDVELAFCFVCGNDLCLRKFRTITSTTPSLQSARFLWCSDTPTSRASEAVSFDRSQELILSLQSETLRWCCATAIEIASGSVSFERSHDVNPFRQSNTFRSWRAVDVASKSAGLNLELSHALFPARHSARFRAAFEDCAHARTEQKLRQATCIHEHFHRLSCIA
jgi:hypothetical protein